MVDWLVICYNFCRDATLGLIINHLMDGRTGGGWKVTHRGEILPVLLLLLVVQLVDQPGRADDGNQSILLNF